MCSVLGFGGLAESTCALVTWVEVLSFSWALLRGVILESNCEGTDSHAFSSRILTT